MVRQTAARPTRRRFAQLAEASHDRSGRLTLVAHRRHGARALLLQRPANAGSCSRPYQPDWLALVVDLLVPHDAGALRSRDGLDAAASSWTLAARHTLLGQHALALPDHRLLALRFRLQVRVFPIVQQSLTVAAAARQSTRSSLIWIDGVAGVVIDGLCARVGPGARVRARVAGRRGRSRLGPRAQRQRRARPEGGPCRCTPSHQDHWQEQRLFGRRAISAAVARVHGARTRRQAARSCCGDQLTSTTQDPRTGKTACASYRCRPRAGSSSIATDACWPRTCRPSTSRSHRRPCPISRPPLASSVTIVEITPEDRTAFDKALRTAPALRCARHQVPPERRGSRALRRRAPAVPRRRHQRASRRATIPGGGSARTCDRLRGPDQRG